jgi:phosphohistidine phosphatase
MKRLVVIRHAKSDWSDPWKDDFDRPLNERGKRDAPVMAERLKKKGILPDLIISSPAKRAKKTALIFAEKLGYDPEKILWEKDLYECSTADVYRLIRELGKDAGTLFVFGHNPTWTYFVNELAGVRIDNIPTCGIAVTEISCDWDALEAECGKLIDFDYPKKTDA